MVNLITGASSGLGKYLLQKLDALKYDRTKPEKYNNTIYDLIVHTAHGKLLDNQSFDDYYYSHQKVLNDLLELKTKRFVFISSIEACTEKKNKSEYARCKVNLENYLRSHTDKYLTLRPGLLMGPNMRINQLLKVAINDSSKLTLAPPSTFSVVFYNDILSAIKSNKLGTFNVISNDKVSLKKASIYFKTNPNWGKYIYETPTPSPNELRIKNEYLSSVAPLDRLALFIKYKCWHNSDNFDKYFN